jgi:lactoylglutathione lyase
MKYKNPLLVVQDMERSRAFYKEVLGLDVIMDLGANVTLTGGVCLQTLDSWGEFLNRDTNQITFGGSDAELYFEEDDFDGFAAKLLRRDGVELVHAVHRYQWGQRVVRFYDPDRHIIEVGESMRRVVVRFLQGGMTVEEAAEASQFPVPFVLWCQEHPDEDPPEGQ